MISYSQSIVNVTVRVQDQNDNAPMFQNPQLYFASIREDYPVNEVINLVRIFVQ